MIRTDEVAILMATYNGEKYLSQQIDSIIGQSESKWKLFVHDDGSDDDTISILRSYSEKDSRIIILEYPSQQGACANFFSILSLVDAPYYMFCDQDDVWLPNKISSSINRLIEIERNNNGKPIIIHTDLQVVDERLNSIAPSFWKYEGIHPERINSFYEYSATNVATGCTMCFNRKAKQVMIPPTHNTLMHDAWLLLSVVAAGGIVKAFPDTPILYRQHDHNTLGARNVKQLTLFYRLRHIMTIARLNRLHYKQMNDIHHVSILRYFEAKIRYRL